MSNVHVRSTVGVKLLDEPRKSHYYMELFGRVISRSKLRTETPIHGSREDTRVLFSYFYLVFVVSSSRSQRKLFAAKVTSLGGAYECY